MSRDKDGNYIHGIPKALMFEQSGKLTAEQLYEMHERSATTVYIPDLPFDAIEVTVHGHSAMISFNELEQWYLDAKKAIDEQLK